MKIGLVVVAAVVVLVGCASAQQNVNPVSKLSVKQMCIVQNPQVSQAGFLDALQLAMRQKGMDVQVVSPGAGPAACPQVVQYTANYRWDLALYLAYAEIRVYQDQREVGLARYDAMRVAGPSKFIKGEEKVRELVGQLFPF
jgi:hypothetical protein